MATRGRPPVIEKAELPLSDGSTILLRLVGDGKTAQIELPEQWTLQSFERSQDPEAGRTRVAYTVATRRGKAKGARPPKAESNAEAKPAPRKRAPAKKAAAAPAAPAAAKKAPAKAPAKKAAAAPRKRAPRAKKTVEAAA